MNANVFMLWGAVIAIPLWVSCNNQNKSKAKSTAPTSYRTSFTISNELENKANGNLINAKSESTITFINDSSTQHKDSINCKLRITITGLNKPISGTIPADLAHKAIAGSQMYVGKAPEIILGNIGLVAFHVSDNQDEIRLIYHLKNGNNKYEFVFKLHRGKNGSDSDALFVSYSDTISPREVRITKMMFEESEMQQ